MRRSVYLVDGPMFVQHRWGAEGEPHFGCPLVSLQIQHLGRRFMFPYVLIHVALVSGSPFPVSRKSDMEDPSVEDRNIFLNFTVGFRVSRF